MQKRDFETIKWQLGRHPRGLHSIVRRCEFDCPQVVITKPMLGPGQVFPTTYWLTCPHLVKEVSRLESTGMIAQLTELAASNTDFAKALEKAHEDYSTLRQSLLSPKGWETLLERHPDQYVVLKDSGIAGIRGPGVKCLHAHLAHFLAGGENPVGRRVWELIKCKSCSPTRSASIGIGTNSTRLLIAENLCNVRPIHEDIRYPRIGEGLQEGRLTNDAMSRTIKVIQEFLKVTEESRVQKVVIFATSGVRSADNQEEFCRCVQQATKRRIRILSGKEEAKWSYTGATYGAFPKPNLVDIGGGSTEFVLDEHFTSIDIGAVRLHEAYLSGDLPTSDEIDQAVRQVMAMLIELPQSKNPLVVVGGTATTLVSMELGLREFDSKMIHGSFLTEGALNKWINRLARLTVSERTALPGLPRERADIIFSGAIILRAVMQHFEVEEVQISTNDIMLGALLWLQGRR